MSFIAPFWLIGAGIVAAGVFVAHLFSTSTPPEQVLPTARFVPQGTPMAVLRTTRLTDVGLMLLRMLAVLLFGMALAGAHVPSSGPKRVVLVDASRAVGTARADDVDRPDDADKVIVFDSVPRAVSASVLDTVRAGAARGSLSAALVAAHRSIADVTKDRDEIELVIVSPMVQEEVDSATAGLIALWEGAVRLQRIQPAAAPKPGVFEVRATGDDPIAAALSTERRPGAIGVRIVRGHTTATDSAWARRGGALVHWPLSASSGSSAWAVSNARYTVVGIPKPDRALVSGAPIVRWSDGAPAATESPIGSGCIRDVAIPVDPIGDISLRDSFRGLARSLLEPCGGARDFTPVPDSLILPGAKAAKAGIAPETGSRLPAILALLALIVLGAEQLLRRKARA